MINPYYSDITRRQRIDPQPLLNYVLIGEGMVWVGFTMRTKIKPNPHHNLRFEV